MACPHAFRPVGRAALGAVRHIFACSRPHHHESNMEIDSEASSIIEDTQPSFERSADREALSESGTDMATCESDSDSVPSRYHSIAELHAILRHIQVRWQLFNESMFKFHDPEAMIANCTDDVVWSTRSGNIIEGKSQELLSQLTSLIERKVFLEVKIDRIIRVVSSGGADLMLDRRGQCRHPSALEAARTSAALKALRLTDPITQIPCQSGTTLGALFSTSEVPSTVSLSRPLFWILAEDSYVLKSTEGNVVEKGRRAVLWQQNGSSWYIRGYLHH
ncbi:hypothetical protein KP509_09G033000 [Ceratopteris richardii]|uniref:Uncharacterized protein n=1 Tax=Ceratopteris richardii TaxID=49495 RepID=A0A8T2U3M7_CERRI|nr:hypothetical protein KP509_09G033000 [Ceratopteris richardii]KAH7429151.1 hypothetical protein KP509_09G033000 [Ceratopteris richardii]